jgi:hypothetical protein
VDELARCAGQAKARPVPPLATLDVRPQAAIQILRQNKIAVMRASSPSYALSMAELDKTEIARQVVLTWAAGVAGYLGPGAGALAAAAVPLALAGLDHMSGVINSRRLEHDTETLLDAAEAFGANTAEEFGDFIKAALSDEWHQELLARALTIAQDTAMRDKRRALGRALAAAASDTGTRVDEELQFIRVLADLDEPHIRLLRLMSTSVSQWPPWRILEQDPGLTSPWALQSVLARHQLISGGHEVLPPHVEIRPDYTITEYGEWFLTRLAEPE